jgi:hypothetical protein
VRRLARLELIAARDVSPTSEAAPSAEHADADDVYAVRLPRPPLPVRVLGW